MISLKHPGLSLVSFYAPGPLEADCHSTSTTSKGLSENLKKMSWDYHVSPIDAKNSVPFFVQFFWVSLDL